MPRTSNINTNRAGEPFRYRRPHQRPISIRAGFGSRLTDSEPELLERESHNYQLFQPPDTLVLPGILGIDTRNNTSPPRLDILHKGFKVERQRSDYCIWDASRFARLFCPRGKPIMGGILGEKSDSSGIGLWQTLRDGERLPVVYQRASGGNCSSMIYWIFTYLIIST
jgi:hypothetical protein